MQGEKKKTNFYEEENMSNEEENMSNFMEFQRKYTYLTMTEQSSHGIATFVKKYKLIDKIIFIGILGIIVLTSFGVIPPWSHGGIYCDDPNIKFRFQGDTVSTIWLFIGILIPPFLVIYVTGLLNVSKQISNSVSPASTHENAHSVENQQQSKQCSSRNKLALNFTRVYYGSFLNGLLFGILLTEFLKSLVVEPRPHFLDTCKPLNLNCTEQGQFILYDEISCYQENGGTRAISDVKKSFPSGHALLSTYAAIFMVVFAQRKIGTTYSSLWKHLLQMVFICFALLCSISRIMDKRHHWWDVLAGIIFGISLAVITVKWHVNDFKMKTFKSQYSPEEVVLEFTASAST